MGLLRAIGRGLAGGVLRSAARRLALRQLDHWAARAVTASSLQTLLSDCVTAAGGSHLLPVVPIDTTGSPAHYRLACSVELQNFDRVTAARASREEHCVRWSFRAVQYPDRPEPWLEALVWHPSQGPASALRPVFRAEAATGRDMFVQLLATALKVTLPLAAATDQRERRLSP